MAERTVQLAGITYRAAEDAVILSSDGKPVGVPVHEFAQMGEEVDVHEADLKRFDRLNEVTGPATPRVALQEEVARNSPAGPGPLSRGAGAVEAEDFDEEDVESDVAAREEATEPKRPRNKANLAEWQDYAEAIGVEVQDEDGNFKTKATLIDETADAEEEED